MKFYLLLIKTIGDRLYYPHFRDRKWRLIQIKSPVKLVGMCISGA